MSKNEMKSKNEIIQGIMEKLVKNEVIYSEGDKDIHIPIFSKVEYVGNSITLHINDQIDKITE